MVNGINNKLELAYQIKNQTQTQNQEKNQVSTKPQNQVQNQVQNQEPTAFPLQIQTQVKNQIQDQVTIQNKILQQSRFQTQQKTLDETSQHSGLNTITNEVGSSELNGLFRIFLGDINRIFHKALSLLKGDKSLQGTIKTTESMLNPSLNKSPRSILREFNLDLSLSDANSLDFRLSIEGTSVWKGQVKSVSLNLEIHLEQIETSTETPDVSSVSPEEVLEDGASTEAQATLEGELEGEAAIEKTSGEEGISVKQESSPTLKPVTPNIVDTGRYFVAVLDHFTFDIYDKKNSMCTRFCAMSANRQMETHNFNLQIALLDATQVRFSFSKENNETSLEVKKFEYSYTLLKTGQLKEAA